MLFVALPSADVAAPGRHEAFYRSRVEQRVVDPSSGNEFTFLPDELVQVEVSHKVCLIIASKEVCADDST